MLVLGLLFIIGAAAVTAGAIYDGGEDATVEILGTTVNTTIAGVFGAGLVSGLLFLLGIWMLIAGTARSRRKRVERKNAKARHRDSVAEMEEERAQLRAENEQLQERLTRGGEPAAVTGAGAGYESRTDDTGATQSWRPGDPDGSRTDETGSGIDSEAGRRREGV